MLAMIITNIFQALLFIFFIQSVFPLKYENKKSMYFFMFLIQIICLTYINKSDISQFSMFILFSFYTIILHYGYKGNLLSKVYFILIFIVISIFSEIIALNCLKVFCQTDNLFDKTSLIFYIGMFISKIIQFLIILSVKKFIKINSFKIMPKSIWLILILPFTTVMFVFSLSNYILVSKEKYMMLIILVCLMISNYIMLFIIEQIIKAVELKKDYINLKNKEFIAQLNYNTLKKHLNNNYSILHKVRNNTSHIIELASKNDTEKLICSIHSLYYDITKLMSFCNTTLEPFNIAADNYAKIFNDYNIVLKAQIEFDDFSFIQSIDQLSLFSEIFRILTDACIQTDHEKLIMIKIKKLKSNIVVQCTCSKTHKAELKVNNIIVDIINKYNGKYSLENFDDHSKLTIIFHYMED